MTIDALKPATQLQTLASAKATPKQDAAAEQPVVANAAAADQLALTATPAATDRVADAAPATDADMAFFDDFAATSTVPAKGKWTVAVNLSATMYDEKGNAVVGAGVKRKQLEDLAAQTAGTGVTIVAQETVRLPTSPPSFEVKRYTLADGKIAEGEAKPSQGTAKDLENLVADAYADHPSEKTALIQQSHGLGSGGLGGDAGRATLEESTAAIRNGLSRAGVDKLDTLDFDACLMGQSEVLDEVSGLADQVVASAELENASKAQVMGEGVDGQDTIGTLEALLANPDMDGKALGNTLVELSGKSQAGKDMIDAAGKKGPNGVDDREDRQGLPADPNAPAPDPRNPGAYKAADHVAGTDTVANFDMADYAAYRESLDGLGGALEAATQDPASRAALQEVIDATPRYGTAQDPVEARSAQRDVLAFTENLEAAIADGSLPDPTGVIGRAAKQTREALGTLTDSYHGNENGAGYEQLGGLGVFLPSDAYFEGPIAAAPANNPVRKLADHVPGEIAGLEAATDPAAIAGRTAEINRQVGEKVRRMRMLLQDAPALKDLTAANARLQAATTKEATLAALRDVDAANQALLGSPAFEQLTQAEVRELQLNIEGAYKDSQKGDGTGGWDRFTRALRP